MNQILNPEICAWDTAQYLVFSDNVFGSFIYYSHFLPAIAAILISVFVFYQNPKNLASRALLFISSCFAVWSFLDLILWATEKTHYTMFVWSIMIFFDLLIYIGSVYFIHAFVENKNPPRIIEVIIFLSCMPLVLLGHTKLNLLGFDYTNCNREALEGTLWHYTYAVEVLLTFWIGFFSIRKWFQTDDAQKRVQIALSSLGIILFLFAFSLGNIAGSLEIDWELGQYGLFGMPIFVIFLTYLIVKYQSLNIKLIGTEALISGILILILSTLFIRSIENIHLILGITFVLTTILGYLLTRSVKKEIKARERNEELAKELAKTNTRLRELDRQKSEFVSIASHQLRSPLTSIRGYTSMLMEGSFGKLPQKAVDTLGRILESSSYMALSIEDFLNVSRIEQGRMKYENADVDVCDMAKKVAEEMQQAALKKGLVLLFRSEAKGSTVAHVDPGKTRQVIYNLIDNALKYTPKGSIDVVVRSEMGDKKMSIDIRDTGVGISKETAARLFDKFVRARNANSVNVSGTGLGLYVAKQMIEAMGGKITIASDGEGKGSTFTIELPLA